MQTDSKKTLLHALLLFLILLVAGWFSLSQLAFWSPDTGLRYMLARQFIENGWQTPAIEYAARFLDPELNFVPYYYIYIVIGEEIFLRIPTLFPLVASFLMASVGRLGLILPPVLGGVACGLATYKLGRLGGVRHGRLLLWASILGTPLLFYSLTFWDHTFVAAFSLWAMVLLARGITGGGWKFVLAAGILAGVSVAERAEFAVFVAALGLSLLLMTRIRMDTALAFGAGNFLSLLPLSLLQHRWIGTPFGVTYATYLFDYGVPERYPFSPSPDLVEPLTRTLIISRMLTYIEGRDPVTFGATILCLIGILIVVLALRMPRWRKRNVFLTGAALSAAGYLMWVSNVAHTGFIPTLALLPFSAALVTDEEISAEQRVYRFALIATLVFMATMPLIWPGYGGNHWATRYMLPAYPLLVYAAFYSYEYYADCLPLLRRSMTISFVGLLVLSVLIQYGGVRLLFRAHAQNMQDRESLQRLPTDIVVTNSPFLASEMVVLDKAFLFLWETDDFKTLVPRMWENDVKSFAVAPLAQIPLEVPEKVGDIELHEVQPFVFHLEAASVSTDATER